MRKYTTAGRVAALFCFAVALSSSAVASGGAAGAPTDGLRLHLMLRALATPMDEIAPPVATTILSKNELAALPHITNQ